MSFKISLTTKAIEFSFSRKLNMDPEWFQAFPFHLIYIFIKHLDMTGAAVKLLLIIKYLFSGRCSELYYHNLCRRSSFSYRNSQVNKSQKPINETSNNCPLITNNRMSVCCSPFPSLIFQRNRLKVSGNFFWEGGLPSPKLVIILPRTYINKLHCKGEP